MGTVTLLISQVSHLPAPSLHLERERGKVKLGSYAGEGDIVFPSVVIYLGGRVVKLFMVFFIRFSIFLLLLFVPLFSSSITLLLLCLVHFSTGITLKP